MLIGPSSQLGTVERSPYSTNDQCWAVSNTSHDHNTHFDQYSTVAQWGTVPDAMVA